jgi:pyridoxal biosynthesis lyase PdxS
VFTIAYQFTGHARLPFLNGTSFSIGVMATPHSKAMLMSFGVQTVGVRPPALWTRQVPYELAFVVLLLHLLCPSG